MLTLLAVAVCKELLSTRFIGGRVPKKLNFFIHINAHSYTIYIQTIQRGYHGEHFLAMGGNFSDVVVTDILEPPSSCINVLGVVH